MILMNTYSPNRKKYEIEHSLKLSERNTELVWDWNTVQVEY